MSQQDDQFLNITVTPVPNPTEEKKTPTADVVVVVDASGSMKCMGNEPMEAVNGFIEDQKTMSTDPDARLSLYTFNTQTTTVHKEVKLSEVKEFTQYTPGGMTALYECVHLAITEKVDGDRKKNVCLVVITDGAENASSPEYNKDNLKKMIKMVERDHGWQVMFLGANIDAFAEGNKMGTSSHHCAQYDQGKKGDLCAILRTTSAAVNHYRSAAYANLAPTAVDLTRMRSTP
jgi:Mg-chelatase subunit ChlD